MFKCKILHVGPSYNSKGGIANVINLYKKFRLIDDENICFVPTYTDINRLKSFVLYVSFLLKFIFMWNIKIIHIHSSANGSFIRKSIILLLAKFLGKKVIFHVHGSAIKDFFQKHPKFVRFILEKADTVIALSEQWKNVLSEIAPKAKLKLVYNPVEIKNKITRPYRENINITFMGKICKQKGVYEIIDAVSKVYNERFVFNLYGHGNLDEFQNLIDQKKLSNKIKLRGWVNEEEKDKVYIESDLFILPSLNEGLSMAILEAMSWQLPIISTKVGGTPEVVKNELNGFLINPKDSQTLSEKISTLIDNLELRIEMGEQSYKIVKEKCDILKIIEQLKALYEESV